MAQDQPVDAAPAVADDDDIIAKEERQKKHYFYLKELQSMARELPAMYQQRLPYDLLCGLANALLDGTVADIVTGLKEVQQLEERHLSSQRIKMINEHKAAKQELKQKHREALQHCQSRPHNLLYVTTQCEKEMESLEKRFEDELKKKDMKVILELDQKVMDQQVMLERAGVPGFFVTNSPNETRLQMYLLDFIIRISQLSVSSS